MSLYGAFDQTRHLNELFEPLSTQGEGVLSPAQRRARVQASLAGATVVSDALLVGIGTSAAPQSLGTTAGNAINYRFTGANTTGDMRGMYLKLNFTGAGGSGEALRAVGSVENVTAATGGTVNGAHITMQVNGASGAISGAANALRATFGVGTGVTPGGTLSALQVDSDVASGVTLPASHAFIRFTNSGATSFTRLIEVPTVASAGILAVHTTQVMTHSIRMRSAAGTLYYLMVTDAATNRTGGA